MLDGHDPALCVRDARARPVPSRILQTTRPARNCLLLGPSRPKPPTLSHLRPLVCPLRRLFRLLQHDRGEPGSVSPDPAGPAQSVPTRQARNGPPRRVQHDADMSCHQPAPGRKRPSRLAGRDASARINACYLLVPSWGDRPQVVHSLRASEGGEDCGDRGVPTEAEAGIDVCPIAAQAARRHAPAGLRVNIVWSADNGGS